MHHLAYYFDHLTPVHRGLIQVGGITLFWLIESALPLFRFGETTPGYRKLHHAGINFFFTLTTILVNFTLAFLLWRTSGWAVRHHIGLLPWIDQWSFPGQLGLKIGVGLLVLDLVGAWLAHWTEHRVKWMWQFHLIHHTDTHVDTTTANRHHPGESLIRFSFTLLAVIITGAPLWLVFGYQALSVVFSQFNHANVVLPRWADRVLNIVIVTPNMHHVHHHYVLPVTNTNYGNIFPYWDRLFGTYHEMDNRSLRYGLDTHPEPHEHSRIGSLLKIPFQPHRPPVATAKPEPEPVGA